MSDEPQFPVVEAAVTLIERGGTLLAVYNPKWSSFSLPMTKRRRWEDPQVPTGVTQEDWVDAAARAAAEWLGRTSTTQPALLTSTIPGGPAAMQPGPAKGIRRYFQSDRDKKYKEYRFQIFQVSLAAGAPLRAGATAEWLTAAEFLNDDRRPISPTARFLIRELQAVAGFTGAAFPQASPPSPVW